MPSTPLSSEQIQQLQTSIQSYKVAESEALAELHYVESQLRAVQDRRSELLKALHAIRRDIRQAEHKLNPLTRQRLIDKAIAHSMDQRAKM